MLSIDPYTAAANTGSSEHRTTSDLFVFTEKMVRANIHKKAIDTFSMYYRQLRSGVRGLLPEADITPISANEITDHHTALAYRSHGESLLARTVVIKLNGGLGTTMGCDGPKSLIKIQPGLDFLGIAIESVRKFTAAPDDHPALVLMNSFHTDNPTRDALRNYPSASTLPRSFLQHKFPKVTASTLLPAECPQNPQLEWNPPGHGDLFSAIDTSGILNMLLGRNYRYAFISNIDNVGAELDTGILGLMAGQNIDFLMEVADRCAADRKGGHIARHRDGRLILRESAQCPEDDIEAFGDISRHRFFNTNNLWIDLAALRKLLDRHDGILNLPLICNQKNLDPVDPGSPAVYQLESAMGAALSLFTAAAVLRVPRSRFIPVKSCDDLLLVQSDSFTLNDNFTIRPVSDHLTEVKLDRAYYATIDQLIDHFPHGAPSLRECRRFTVEGEVLFGNNVTISGSVKILNRSGRAHRIPDNSRIDHDLEIN